MHYLIRPSPNPSEVCAITANSQMKKSSLGASELPKMSQLKVTALECEIQAVCSTTLSGHSKNITKNMEARSWGETLSSLEWLGHKIQAVSVEK